ncbi:FHIPEP family type III secretion protein [candidate division KSB1 bacterium]|nr:FHIPEP family type III secretion protein [candidate division KSB1 bacterium]
MSKDYESLKKLLESIDSAENPELRLIDMTIEAARKKSAELAEALRYCALPHRFNAEIISVMQPNHRDLAFDLLDHLRSYEFVIERESGWYVYHDNTRDVLLDDWRSADKEESFREYNERLINFFEEQGQTAKKAEDDWNVVAPIIRSANQKRYYSMAKLIEQQLLTPLIELLYHKTLQSAEEGYKSFETQCFELEQENPTMCLSLLNITRSYLTSVAPKKTEQNQLKNLMLWLDYFEARLNQALNSFSTEGMKKVKESLDNLAQNEKVQQDNKLYIWVLNQLGNVLNSLAFYNEAYEAYDKSLALSKKHEIDLYNLAVYYSNLANIHWTRGDLRKAFEYYSLSVEKAKQEYNNNLEILSSSSLCILLLEQGERDAALARSLDLLLDVWKRFLERAHFHSNTLLPFFHAFAGKEPYLLDTAFKGLNTLLDLQGDPRVKSDLHLRYISLLTDAGRIKRAESEFASCVKGVDQSSDPNLEKDLLYRRAFLYEEQGNLQEAIEKYIELNRHSQVTGWDKGASLTNLGRIYIKLFELETANRYLQDALSAWDELDLKKLAALTRLVRAELLIKQGNIKEAQKQLELCHQSLSQEFHSYQMDFHTTQGKLHEALGDWPAAQAQYQRAVEICLSRDLLVKNTAERYSDLIRIAAIQANWKDVVDYSHHANGLWKSLKKADSYSPDSDHKRADEFFADAFKVLFASSNETWNSRLAAAQELFSRAANLKSANILYSLYWMLTSSGLEDWPEAISAVNMIIDHGPQWINHHTFIEARLIEYRMQQSSAELANKNYDKVASIYKRMQRRLKHPASFVKIANNWIELGDLQLAEDEIGAAYTRYRSGLVCAKRSQNLELQANFYARLGFLAAIYKEKLIQQDISIKDDEALSNFAKAIDLFSRSHLPSPGSKVGEICVTLIHRIELYWQMDAQWQAYILSNRIDKAVHNELLSARKASTAYFAEIYQLSATAAETANLLPVVTPIVVEIDTSILPEGPDSEWLLFKTYLPEMRNRIQTDMGVIVPGIRIRGNDSNLARGSYIIMIDEVPRVIETLQHGKVYCPVSLQTLEAVKIPRSAIIEKSHPLTGGPGCWIGAECVDILQENGINFWPDPLLFMVYHLELYLRRNLAHFLGMQEIDNLIIEWQESSQGKILVETVLPDSEARIRFASVLSWLIKEHVPINSWEKILSVLKSKGLMTNTIEDLLRAVRLELKEELPGNTTEVRHINLPHEIEDQISNGLWRQNGKSFLAIPAGETQNLLSQIRELVNPDDNNQVLVVERTEIRPFVRRLVELEHPMLMVIARDELLSKG